MGGHGGLNILPQKRWNVYNYDNREKVRRDEEAAAKEEQLKREQTRKRDAEFRLEQLRTARGLAPLKRSAEESEPKTGHINLFEGIKIFDPIQGGSEEKKGGDDRDDSKKKKKKKKEEGRAKVVVTAEEEKYRLGYGVAGKGVKLPWYLERRREDVNTEKGGGEAAGRVAGEDGKRGGKKTVEELREERLRRERREKERERALLMENNTTHGASAFISDRNPCRSRSRSRR